MGKFLNTQHILILQDLLTLRCSRCGAVHHSMPLNLESGISIEIWNTVLQSTLYQFAQDHQDCCSDDCPTDG